MSTKKKIYLILAIVLAIVWVGIYKSGVATKALRPGSGSPLRSEEKIIPKVQVQLIEAQDEVSIPLVLSGKVKPKKYTLVKSLAGGYLQYMATIGDEVRAGQDLFRVYDEGIEAGYYNALAGLMTAQDNLNEIEASAEENIKQAELGVKIAEASLNLANASLENIKKSGEQGIMTALDSGQAAYASAYSSVEQMMRFLGGGNVQKYAFKNLLNHNSQARTNVENNFMRVKNLYMEEIERREKREETRNKKQETKDDDYDDEVVVENLNKMDELVEEVKRLADLAYIDLNYCMSTISVSDTVISGYKTQLASLLISLNAANSGIKGSINGIKIAKISAESAIEAAGIGVSQAENGLENARASYELALSGMELRKLGAQAQLNGAQAQFDSAKYRFDNLMVSARFSGVVISNLVEVGEQVNIGMPVLEMGDVDAVEIELEVGTREVRQLTIGSDANIRMHSNDTNNDDIYTGQLTEIEPAALGASGKVKIKVEADNSDYQFVPGEVAEVELELVYSGDDMIVVPLDSVVVGQNESYVWIVDTDGDRLKQIDTDYTDVGNDEVNKVNAIVTVVNKRTVELGEVYGEMVDIVDGLEQGDLVVVENGGFLSVGDRVEVEE